MHAQQAGQKQKFARKAHRQGWVAHEFEENGCKVVVVKLVVLCFVAVIPCEARVCRTDLLELNIRFCFIVGVFVWVPAELSEAYHELMSSRQWHMQHSLMTVCCTGSIHVWAFCRRVREKTARSGFICDPRAWPACSCSCNPCPSHSSMHSGYTASTGLTKVGGQFMVPEGQVVFVHWQDDMLQNIQVRCGCLPLHGHTLISLPYGRSIVGILQQKTACSGIDNNGAVMSCLAPHRTHLKPDVFISSSLRFTDYCIHYHRPVVTYILLSHGVIQAIPGAPGSPEPLRETPSSCLRSLRLMSR